MMKPAVVCSALSIVAITSNAIAHYGMVIPSDTMVMEGEPKELEIQLAFAHPFERAGMPLAKPEKLLVQTDGKTQDLTDDLKQESFLDEEAWQTTYEIEGPGVYVFAMEPQPYWEPAEDLFIKHYTKVYVAAFGVDEGWDTELGLETEIVPLSRPFGLYAGNVFQGIVKLNGEPVPQAEVEVEHYNREGAAQAPTDYMVTQTIKADTNGVFTYAAPQPGWWGFAALNTADRTLDHEGEQKALELGAVLWVHFLPWQTQ